jgi:hypothetical protein
VNHLFGLGGQWRDLHVEDALDAMGGRDEAFGVVQVADGDVDAGGQPLGTGGLADQRAHLAALLQQMGHEGAADVAGGPDDEVAHGVPLPRHPIRGEGLS